MTYSRNNDRYDRDGDDCDRDGGGRRDRDRDDRDRDDCDGGSDDRNSTAQISGDTTASVTEDSGRYTVTGDLNCSDADRGQSSLKSISNKAGKYGTFSVDSSGNWTYKLDNSKSSVQSLDKGEKVYDTFDVWSYDGSAKKTVTVTVNGADEAPQSTGTQVGGTTTGSVTEDASVKTASARLTIDGKTTSSGFNTLTKQGTYGTFTMKADGTWIYTIDNSKAVTQALNAGDKKTESFDVYTKAVNNYCGPDVASVKKTIVVTVNGADETPTSSPTAIGGDAEGTVKEDTAAQTVDTGRLTINGQNSSSGFNALTKAGVYGTFTMTANGTWTYTIDNAKAVVQALNEGQKVIENFDVSTKAINNYCGPDTPSYTKKVVINVLGTDEAPQSAPVITGSTTGSTIEDVTLSSVGKLTVTGDTGFQAVTAVAGTYGSLSMTAAGNWTYSLNNTSSAVQTLNAAVAATDVFTVKSASGTTQVLTMTVTGTNDAPVANDDNAGWIDSSIGYRRLIDVLDNDTDIDAGHTLKVASVQGISDLGAIVSIDLATGMVDYDGSRVNADQDRLDTFTYVTMDDNGATDVAVVTIGLSAAEPQ